MASATLTQPHAPSTQAGAPDAYMRAVWGKLAAGAIGAAIAAWLLAQAPPLRGAILIEHAAGAVGLTVIGVVIVMAPASVWSLARLFAPGPNPLNPAWYWLFVIAVGACANTLALLFMRDSIVSIFLLAALGFTAVHFAHYFARALPVLVSAVVFIAAVLIGEYAINAVLKGSWPFTALDLVACAGFAALILLRAGAFSRLRDLSKRANQKASVTYAAMHLIALTHARLGAKSSPTAMTAPIQEE